MIDTNIVIDLLDADAHWQKWSQERLLDVAESGPIAVSAVIVGELSARFDDRALLFAALEEFSMDALPLNPHAGFLAGQAHRAYREAGGTRAKLLGDFLIGGHAAAAKAMLLTRDARRYRAYFPDLTLITPETDNG